MNQIVIPPGFTVFPGTCQCGKTLIRVDDLEGLPIYACIDRCGRQDDRPPQDIKAT